MWNQTRLPQDADRPRKVDGPLAFRHCRAKGQTWIDGQVKSNQVKCHSAITLASKTCYWLITQEVAKCNYKPTLESLQEQHKTYALFLNRGQMHHEYDSTNTFNNLMGCLSEVMETKVKQLLRQSPFIGIRIDQRCIDGQSPRETPGHRGKTCKEGTCMTFPGLCCGSGWKGSDSCGRHCEEISGVNDLGCQ